MSAPFRLEIASAFEAVRPGMKPTQHRERYGYDLSWVGIRGARLMCFCGDRISLASETSLVLIGVMCGAFNRTTRAVRSHRGGKEGRLMGRAVVKIADSLIGVVLKLGMNAVLPEKSLEDVRVIDARYKAWCVELLLESPDLKGAEDATLDNAPNHNVQMIRKTVLEGDVAVRLIADHMRNADSMCECGKLGLKERYSCPACRSKAALDQVPFALLEQARAARRVAGELVEAPTDERGGEVPGA